MLMMEEPRPSPAKPSGLPAPRPFLPPAPRPAPMNAPGFGYYYPRSLYQMPAARPYGYPPYRSYYY